MADGGEINALLNQPLRLGSGRRAKPIRCEYAGDLTVEDLLRASTVEMGSTAPTVKQLRQIHHTLARVLAQGVKPQEAAIICGYSISRISILKADPAFAELLEYYKDMEADQYSVARADMHGRLANLGFDSLELLHERLIDEPEGFDNKTLLAVVEAAADRTGHGKTSTVNHDHQHALSDETIAKLKAATLEGRAISEEDRGALVRLASLRTAQEHPEAEEAHWVEGGGSGLREEGGEGIKEPLSFGGVALPSVDPV